jgi:hypothetical protein
MYEITDYTKQRAKELGVRVLSSTKKNKKLDIYKDGRFITSVGDTRYGDYPTFMKLYGLEFANKRRKAYHQRHKNDSGIAGKIASYLLW